VQVNQAHPWWHITKRLSAFRQQAGSTRRVLRTRGLTKTLYKMKLLLIFILITINSQCFADTVEEGDYIDARGVFRDCNSKLFLTEVVKTEGPAPITIFYIPDIQVLGKTERQIEVQIENKLENHTGNCKTLVGKKLIDLHISILRTEPEIKPVRKGRAQSLPVGERECSSKGSLDNGSLEELEEKLRKVELLKAVASARLYNKSFKFVPPASWLHPTRTAYARLN